MDSEQTFSQLINGCSSISVVSFHMNVAVFLYSIIVEEEHL